MNARRVGRQRGVVGAQDLEHPADRREPAVRHQGADRRVGRRIAGPTQRVEKGVIRPAGVCFDPVLHARGL
jgi:hypothetical protein